MQLFGFSLRQLLISQAIVAVGAVVILAIDPAEIGGWNCVFGIIAAVLIVTITGVVLSKLHHGFSNISRLSAALSSGDLIQALQSDRQDEFSSNGNDLNRALRRLRRFMNSLDKAVGNLNEFTSNSSLSAEKSASLVEE